MIRNFIFSCIVIATSSTACFGQSETAKNNESTLKEIIETKKILQYRVVAPGIQLSIIDPFKDLEKLEKGFIVFESGEHISLDQLIWFTYYKHPLKEGSILELHFR